MYRCFHVDNCRCERNAVSPYKYCELHMSEAKCVYCTNNRCGRHCIYSQYPFDKKSKLCGTIVPDNNISRICYVHSKLWCQLCGNTLICYDQVCRNSHCRYARCHNLASVNGLCKVHEHTLCTSCDKYSKHNNQSCVYCDRYICKTCNFMSMYINKICALCISDIELDTDSLSITTYINIYLDHVVTVSAHTGLNDRTCGVIVSYVMKKIARSDLFSAQQKIQNTIDELEDTLDTTRHRITMLHDMYEKSTTCMNYV